MNVITPVLPPGARSLPAEFLIPRQYRKADWVTQRLLAGANRVQSGGGVRGIAGVGDVMCPDGTSAPTLSDCVSSGNWGSTIDLTTGSSGTPVVISAGDPNFNWAGLTSAIAVGSTSLAKILAATNPGTYYKDPQGNVIYSQPTGNTQNLPGVYGNVGGGAVGSFVSPLGTASFGGISSSTLMMGAVLLLAFMMMGRR